MRSHFKTATRTTLDGWAFRFRSRLLFVTTGGSLFDGVVRRRGGQDIFDGHCRTKHGGYGFHFVGHLRTGAA